MPSAARDFPCFEFEISAVANQLALVLTYCVAAVVVNHSAASQKRFLSPCLDVDITSTPVSHPAAFAGQSFFSSGDPDFWNSRGRETGAFT